jgi:autotransporter-associated beta strand protein
LKIFFPTLPAFARSIEWLESRIAPASLLLAPDDGPFTLELDPIDSHLHVKNGAGTEIFDQGGPTPSVGDDLFVTGGGSADTFTIIQTAAGDVVFTGTLDVNIAGPIIVSGPVSTGTELALTTGESITQTAALGVDNSNVHYTAGKNVLLSGASLNTSNGEIVINANQQTVPASGAFVGIEINNSTISSTTGAISLYGRGGDSSADFQAGVFLQGSSSVGTGTSGLVHVEGAGGDGIGGFNHGVQIVQSTITAGTGGTVEVVGLGGTLANGPFNFGVQVQNGGSITSTDGDVMVTGTGGGTPSSSDNDGVIVDGIISAGGNGKVVVTGQGGFGAQGNFGVLVMGSTSRIAGSGGPVSVIGAGGISSSGNNDGVFVAGGAEIKAVGNGTLDVTGQGGTGGDNNFGVFAQGTNSKIRAALGNMTVTGTGGKGTSFNFGVTLASGAELLAEGGVMSVQGTGGPGNGNSNRGLDFDASSLVTSTGGNVGLIGNGGGTGAASDGTGVNSFANISLPGTGNLTITGTGAVANGSSNVGVFMEAVLNTAVGNITVQGTGGGTSLSGDNTGVYLNSSLHAGLTGAISVVGFGGAGKTENEGVVLQATVLQTDDGNILVRGLPGTGKNQVGVDIFVSPSTTIQTLGAGNIEIASDQLDIEPGTIIDANTHTVSLHPATSGTRIDITDAPDKIGVLTLADEDLDRVTAGRLNIGDNASGTLQVLQPITRAASTTLALNGAGRTLIYAALDTGGGTLLFSNGVYEIHGDNLIANTTSLNVHAATLYLGPFDDTVQGLTVDHGNILNTGTLTSTTAINFLSGRINAQLGGTAGLIKSSPDTAILGNPNNTFTGSVTINAGTLQVAADGAFGAPANNLAISNATLRTTASFTSPRAIAFNGPATVDVIFATTLTLSGAVTGPGPLVQTGGGTLVIGNAYPFTVDPTSTTMMGGTMTVDGATVTLGGGTIVVHTGPAGSHAIESIEVSDTTPMTSLTVKSPTGTVTEIAKIISANPADSLAKIALGKGVMFGDGMAGVASDPTVPDLAVAGKLGALTLDGISANTLVTLGKGLPYNANPGDPTDPTPDTYNQKPALKINRIMGPGVTFDLTPLRDNMGNYIRDDFGNYVGGGGLGKVTVEQWGPDNGTSYPGVIKTSQSVTSFTLKKGDCGVTFEVDKEGVGTTTPGNVGTIKVLNGSWTSAGNVIDGYVGLFDVGGFTAGADLHADYIQKKFLVRGTFTDINGVAYGGTTILDQDIASGAFNISVGDFSGKITATGPIGKFVANGTYSGALTAKSILSITADEFVKIGLTGPLIKSTGGAIGTVTTKFGGIANTTIESSTNIGKITSKGAVTGSKILAGADPDNNGNFVAGDPTPTGTLGALAITGVLDASTIAARTLDAMTFRYGQPAATFTVLPTGVSTTLIALESFKTATAGLKVDAAPTILNASLPTAGHYYFKFLDAANMTLGTIHVFKTS